MLLATSPGRRSAEADILLTSSYGSRVGVDVKHSVIGTYRSAPSPSMLAVVRLAIERGDIASFDFITTGRFLPAFRRQPTNGIMVQGPTDSTSSAERHKSARALSRRLAACARDELCTVVAIAQGMDHALQGPERV